jgi:hypothetical protein
MAKEVGLLDVGGREILRCAQDDKPRAVILSAAKDLARIRPEEPTLSGDPRRAQPPILVR